MSIFKRDLVTRLQQWITEAKHIVIVSHRSPDGDSIGSSLGLAHYLELKGYASDVCHPDPAPEFLNWLDGAKEIINIEIHKEQVIEKLANADLIFCLDFNDVSRVGDDMMPFLRDAKAKKVMIDHHQNPSEFADIVFSDVSCCSTSQLIVELIDASGDSKIINEKIGTPLYCGIMTDTGSFRFASTTAQTHRVIAHLIESGVKNNLIHERVYDTNTLNRLRLQGFALAEKLQIWEDLDTAVISLTQEEAKRFPHQKGDTEGFVNIALSINGMKRAAFFMEKDGIIKISFRSKGIENAVNEIASKYFHGGGHINAAGGKSDQTIEEAIQLFKTVLQNEK